jgi:hypothetical protein
MDPFPSARDVWDNLWLRATVFHPTIFVAPWVLACLALAHRSGSDMGDIDWGFYAVPLGAVASLIATMAMALRSRQAALNRVLVVITGLFASGAGLVVGALGWFWAADVACHGRYECPF